LKGAPDTNADNEEKESLMSAIRVMNASGVFGSEKESKKSNGCIET